jgi:hypothetical protein
MTIQYLAGIVDGEGHFCRPRNKSGQGRYSWESRIIVTNTCLSLMDTIQAAYGGRVRLRIRSKTNNLPCYVWTLTGKRAEALAIRLQPFLIVKAEQVKRLMPPYPGYGTNGRVLLPIYKQNRLEAV